MNKAGPFVCVGLIAGCALVISIQAHRLTAAHSRLEIAQTLLATTIKDAQELLDLRAKQPRIEVRQRPAQDVIALVNSVMSEADIPANHFKSLVPESETAIADAAGTSATTTYRRQSVQLTLENLAVHQLGEFLLHWRKSQPVWVVTHIELTHARSQNARDDHFHATLLLSAIYLSDKPRAEKT